MPMGGGGQREDETQLGFAAPHSFLQRFNGVSAVEKGRGHLMNGTHRGFAAPAIFSALKPPSYKTRTPLLKTLL